MVGWLFLFIHRPASNILERQQQQVSVLAGNEPNINHGDMISSLCILCRRYFGHADSAASDSTRDDNAEGKFRQSLGLRIS